MLDVQNYSAVSNLPVPTVAFREVGVGSGPFSLNNGGAAEASLDTQMSLGTAPGAQETLYDMPDLSNDSVAEAYALVDEDNAVDVVSSSFGQCELDFTAAYNGGTDFTSIPKTFHALFQQGNAQGITFLASSGDNGAPDCVSKKFANAPGVIDGTDFVLGVENPASDPNITAVGGTNLQTAATPTVNDVTRVSENANFDPRVPAVFTFEGVSATVGNNTWGSGGGFSQIFSKPLYQFLVDTGSNVHRSVPDVSLDDGRMSGRCGLDRIRTASICRAARSSYGSAAAPALLIGTSASSPEMAGVLALAVESNRGRLGNVNPMIYALSAVQTIAGGVHRTQGAAILPSRHFRR